MNRAILFAALAVPMALSIEIGAAQIAAAQGVKPVKSGVVIRGITLPPPAGAPGKSARATCDFSSDPVGQHDRLTGSSVNCGPKGTLHDNLFGLPMRFNAYCYTDAPVKSARIIQAPIPGDDNHCDLSGITPKDATRQFGGAVWR